MNLEIIILTKSERERPMPYGITYMWNLKYDMNELMYEIWTAAQTWRRAVAKGGGVVKWRIGGLGLADANYCM